MSIKQMAMVWEYEFTRAEQSVMLALADHAHDDGTDIRPAIDRICWKTGYQYRNVQMTIRELEAKEILIKTSEAYGPYPCVYCINWDKAKPKQAYSEWKKVNGRRAQRVNNQDRGAKNARAQKKVGAQKSAEGRTGDHPNHPYKPSSNNHPSLEGDPISAHEVFQAPPPSLASELVNHPSFGDDLHLSIEDRIEAVVFELTGQGIPNEKIAFELQAMGLIPGYRKHWKTRSAIDRDFAGYLAKTRLASSDTYKNRSVSIADGIGYILRAERDLKFNSLFALWDKFQAEELPAIQVQRRSKQVEALHLGNFIHQDIWPERQGQRIYDIPKIVFEEYIAKAEAYRAVNPHHSYTEGLYAA
jgi:hypothetical protein